MRATVEFTDGEKEAMKTLNGEEREAVIDQMLERVREDIEWVMAIQRAHSDGTEEPPSARQKEPVAVPIRRPRPPSLPPLRSTSPRRPLATREDRTVRRLVIR
jgi:hypothetical protein